MDNLSSRFLDAFNGIENWMRHELNAEHEDFGILLSEMEQSRSGFDRYSSELRRLARLRNLIVHHHSRDEPLAVPTTRSVERIDMIHKQLLSPPLLLSVAAAPVQTCLPTDLIGHPLKKMHIGTFSQLPIYGNNQCLGLLTADTIARWLAVNLAGGVGLVEEKPVSDVIQHQEDPDNHTFLHRTSTVEDGLAAFGKYHLKGKRLDAILITQNGRLTEAPLGIVTIQDIPKLNQAVQV